MNLIKRMDKARVFGVNTCPASRHTQMIAEQLCRGKPYPMLSEEPKHCGESIGTTVAELYEARAKLAELGYTWTATNDKTIWTRKDAEDAG